MLKEYPSLFEQLGWWERQDHFDLPHYLKDNTIGKIVVKVAYWGDDQRFVSEGNKAIGYKQHCQNWLPATLDEYLTYQSTL